MIFPRAILLLLACLVGPAVAQERAPGVRRTVYDLEVDLERARAIGWASGSASDEEVLGNVEQVVGRRLAAMERSFTLHHDVESRRIELTMPQIQPRDRELFGQMLASLGQCEFLLLLDEQHAGEVGIDLAAEKKKLETWLQTNPGVPLELFHSAVPGQELPHPRLLWVTTNLWGQADPADKVGAPRALLLPDRPEGHLGSGSIEGTLLTQDQFGNGRDGYEVRASRADDLALLTESHVGWRLGIVLENRLRTALPMTEKLSGGFFFVDVGLNPSETGLLTAGISGHGGPVHVVEIR